ncbi:MAG: error-prone DNA polymerase [Caulobacteraceae bacterium]
MTYAELQTTTNFSFLRGASHPGELVLTAKALGLAAIGITDRNTLSGVVRAWSKGREVGLRVLIGCRLDFIDGTPSLLVYPTDREAYGRLTRLLTEGQRRAIKGQCELAWADFLRFSEGQICIAVPPAGLDAAFAERLTEMAAPLRGRIWLAAARAYGARDLKRISCLDEIGRTAGAPIVAVNDILYHGPERRPLQDVVSCVREKTTIAQAGLVLEANAERHIKSPGEMARLFKPWPEALARTQEILGLIAFDLGDLKNEYPDEPVPPGKTAMGHLTDLTWQGAAWRYPAGVPEKVVKILEGELALIAELNYPNYFLTVHDIVAWAREQGILCQGRGSAANSVVCFCLGITAVDPMERDVLLARFISRKRSEPPDIDVDFEHERREEVMQYVFARYGREYAAICGTVIHYRPRMAIRDVGKALGLTEDITAALANTVWGSWGSELPDEQIRQAGLDPSNLEIRRATALAEQLMGFPRHLSQHVGGFVLTKRRLDETVPIGNAAMDDRTFIEWDKDDIDDLSLMKVDVLALGMLTTIAKAMKMIREDHGQAWLQDMADIPAEDPAVYDMLCQADSVGVFQVESRAQMSMLPRLKPRCFYDLVIEVAIVRPGPIQGNMVHPYLKRRKNPDEVVYPRPSPEHGPPDEVEGILKKTLGVPLFQEQAMKLAMVAAQFTDDEANGLRKAMATFRNYGHVGTYGEMFLSRMIARGYDPQFAQDCFKQIEGFGSYGFPESHAVSFANLVYVSSWIKRHYPDVFCAALINSQPMGFYQPAQLVRDAREHGVEVRPPCALKSDWDCTLEDSGAGKAVRLGLRQIKGLKEEEARTWTDVRAEGSWTLEGLVQMARPSRRFLELMAEADAFAGLGVNRRDALWRIKGLAPEAKVETEAPLLALLGPPPEEAVSLPAMALPAEVSEDYRTVSLSLKAHPCRFFRERLAKMGAVTSEVLSRSRDGRRFSCGGLVLVRQRPGTAKGVVFMTLEDETGVCNVVVWADVFSRNRRTVMGATFLVVHGRLQEAEGVRHLVAERFTDLSPLIAQMRNAGEEEPPRRRVEPETRLVRSRDFH